MTTHRHAGARGRPRKPKLIACTRCSHLTWEGHRCKPLPMGDIIPMLRCTACGRPSIYSRGLDRYLHCASRYDNAPCWLKIARGDIDQDIEWANCREICKPRRRSSAA